MDINNSNIFNYMGSIYMVSIKWCCQKYNLQYTTIYYSNIFLSYNNNKINKKKKKKIIRFFSFNKETAELLQPSSGILFLNVSVFRLSK